MDGNSTSALPVIVNIIETALTPIFLLAGTAGVLNVISSRLARISDRANEIADLVIHGAQESEARLRQLAYLRRRTLALEIAVILASISPFLPACRRSACWPARSERTIATCCCSGSSASE